jgi:hypothetical protein
MVLQPPLGLLRSTTEGATVARPTLPATVTSRQYQSISKLRVCYLFFSWCDDKDLTPNNDSSAVCSLILIKIIMSRYVFVLHA